MTSKTRWWAGICTLLIVAVLGVLAPAAAWARERPAALAVAGELARRRPRVRGGGLLGAVCCLAVVAVVVLIVVLATRRRRSPRP